MQINFFEEYPTEENISKLDLVDWPATVLVAAASLQEFESIRAVYAQKYSHITFGWWPTISNAYWISGFADPSDLDKFFKEITSKKQSIELPILIDLELPRKKYLYIKNFFNIFRNKKRVLKFLAEAQNYNLKIYTAEYPAHNRFLFKLWQLLGLSPSFAVSHIKLPMCYSSMGIKSLGNKLWVKILNFEKQLALSHKGHIGFGLGTIATGVLGNEPIISPENLSKDLRWAQMCGVGEVFIFRLGGFNERYKSIISM